MSCHCTPERQCELCEAMLDDMPKKPTVYILHGVTDRDPNETVCMIYPTKEEAQSMIDWFPGTYRVAKFEGIDWDAINYIGTEDLA